MQKQAGSHVHQPSCSPAGFCEVLYDVEKTAVELVLFAEARADTELQPKRCGLSGFAWACVGNTSVVCSFVS